MLLGNLLLALAWAALQGEFSLANLVTGHVLGYLILLLLVKGGVLAPSPYVGKVHLAIGLAAFFLWELVRANLRLALDVATPQLSDDARHSRDPARRDARLGDSAAGDADQSDAGQRRARRLRRSQGDVRARDVHRQSRRGARRDQERVRTTSRGAARLTSR